MDSITKASAEDGASEKLVGEKSEGNSARDQKVEIKYMADSQNGDTKIDIENLRTAFVGMGKEELMKFANDPFWVKTRWFLFIIFWILWFAMLCGAIAIIVLAPKCAAPTPREWYEQSPIYKVDIRDFSDSTSQDGIGDLKGLSEHVMYFEDLGINTILMEPVMKITDNNLDKVEDYMTVDPEIGTVEDFKNLMTKLKDKGIHVLMNMVPNYSSDKNVWFLKSVAKEEPFKDFYVWAPGKGRNDEGHHIPPNNWLSVHGGSAWEWNEQRGEFYLHQFDKTQPDLNFRNTEVVQKYKEVLNFWLSLGVSGFFFNHVEYLIEDESLKNESIDSNAVGATHEQYVFYTHRHTTHLPETVKLLTELSTYIRNQSGIVGITGLSDNEGAGISQLISHPLKLSSALSAVDLKEMIEKRLNNSSPIWEWECEDSEYCLDTDVANSLQFSLLLLPGTTVIKAGQELGYETLAAFRSSTNESLPDHKSIAAFFKKIELHLKDPVSWINSYKTLIEARYTQSIMYGATQPVVLNSTVFAYTRIKSGNPGYLVALNLGDDTVTVDFTELKSVPPQVTVVASSQNFKDISIKNKVSSAGFSIPSKASIVVTFVPETEPDGSSG